MLASRGGLVLLAGFLGCGSAEVDIGPPEEASLIGRTGAAAPVPPPAIVVTTPVIGPTDDDPDRDRDPNVGSIDDSTPPVTEDEIAKTFAPHLHLHPDDPNRPANVDWYLERVTMRFNHAGCPDHEILGTGKVTQASLVAQSHANNALFCQHDEGNIALSTTSDRFFLEVTDHASYTGAPRSEWKTYVVWRPRPASALVDVEYWFFYPYNDGFSIFNHESDWEHVRVTVDPKGDGGRGVAIEVKLSAHHGGTILPANDPRLEYDGTHPIAYVAKGTHANYLAPGSFAIEGTAGIATDTTRAAPLADVWKTETALVAIGTRAAPRNGQIFVKYWGRWGELGDLPESNGVTRHFP